MREVFETTFPDAATETTVTEASATYMELSQDSEPVEPRCAADLGSVALCATCPMARFLGVCPRGVNLESVNRAIEVEADEDVSLGSVEMDAGLLLVPVFEPSVREVVPLQAPKNEAKSSSVTLPTTPPPEHVETPFLRQIDTEPVKGAVNDGTKTRAARVMTIEREVAAATESTPSVREVVRPLAPQETFLDALFNDSVTVISAGMVIEEHYDTSPLVNVWTEPITPEPPHAESALPQVTNVATQEMVVTTEPLLENGTTVDAVVEEEAQSVVIEPVSQVDDEISDPIDELPAESVMRTLQTEPEPVAYDNGDIPLVPEMMIAQYSPVAEDVSLITEPPVAAQDYVQEDFRVATELVADAYSLQEEGFESTELADTRAYHRSVLVMEQEGADSSFADSAASVVDTPEFLQVSITAPVSAYSTLSLTTLGSWAVRLLALRMSLARLA